MIQATITSKGQVTIPREIRERYSIEPGDKLEFNLGQNDIRISIIKRHKINDIWESLPGTETPFVGQETEHKAAETYRTRKYEQGNK